MKAINSINNLNASDEILASIEINGKQIASIRRYNFNSVDDVVKTIISIAGNFIGLAKLNIRNRTQGWNMIMGVARQQKLEASVMAMHMKPSNHPYGQQLSIPWN